MYVNADMILLKLFQESGERAWGIAVKEGNSSIISMIHCKNLCKCYNEVIFIEYTTNILKSCVLNENNFNPRILYPAKLSFKID
jgi:hypothetical protein